MPEWPDWTGEACAIIASGPSAKKADVELLKGRLKVVALKKNVETAPFADVVYGCDKGWWKHVRGLPDFKGPKICYDAKACDEFGLTRVLIPDHHRDTLMLEPKGSVGAGGNSAFQALNLVIQWGVTRVLFLGLDCQDRSGAHWYGRNNWNGAANPSETNFRRWRAAFAGIVPQLQDLGVDVVNASPLSDLKAFRKWSVSDTLEAWGL